MIGVKKFGTSMQNDWLRFFDQNSQETSTEMIAHSRVCSDTQSWTTAGLFANDAKHIKPWLDEFVQEVVHLII